MYKALRQTVHAHDMHTNIPSRLLCQRIESEEGKIRNLSINQFVHAMGIGSATADPFLNIFNSHLQLQNMIYDSGLLSCTISYLAFALYELQNSCSQCSGHIFTLYLFQRTDQIPHQTFRVPACPQLCACACVCVLRVCVCCECVCVCVCVSCVHGCVYMCVPGHIRRMTMYSGSTKLVCTHSHTITHGYANAHTHTHAHNAVQLSTIARLGDDDRSNILRLISDHPNRTSPKCRQYLSPVTSAWEQHW